MSEYCSGCSQLKTKLRKAEDTIDRLRAALIAIEYSPPGSAHRIAIQVCADLGLK